MSAGSTSSARGSVDGWRRANRAALLLPAFALVAAGWVRRWTTDDAFINYRIVEQLFAGNGPVFNAGERVESYTSALWLAVLAAFHAILPLPIEYVAVVVALALVGLGVATLTAASCRLLAGLADERTVWLPAGTLVLLALPPMWDFSTAGLETALALTWTGLLALGLARAVEAPARVPSWALVVVGAAPLVRPDMAITGACVGLFIVLGTVRAAGWRPAARQVAVAAALPVAYQVFRMAYFGALVPNTALAKRASAAHWEEGWAYLRDLVAPYWLWLPVVILLAWLAAATRSLPTRARVGAALLPVAGVLHALYLLRAGGDYIHGRLLLPPLFALLAPVAAIPIGRRPAAAAAVAVAAWAVTCALFLRVGGFTQVNRTLIADGRRAVASSGLTVTAEQQGWPRDGEAAERLSAGAVVVGDRPLDVSPPPELEIPATVQFGVGVLGYAAGVDVHVIDRLGLGDAFTSRLEVDVSGFTGHEKPIPDPWLAARISTDPVDPSALGGSPFIQPIYVSPAGRFEQDTEIARSVLDCEPLRELREATTGRLTPSRALANLRRAARLTRLEVPPSPQEARARLC